MFRQRVGAQVLDHVVDAKGYSMFGRLGQRALANGSGGPGWAMAALQKAAHGGSYVAGTLIERARQGRVNFYTSFLDGLQQW